MRGDGTTDPEINARRACEVGVELAHLGFAPYVPHWSYFGDPTSSFAGWLDVDKAWLLNADALLRIPGYSIGAEVEVAFAESRGIPIFHGMIELTEWAYYRADLTFTRTLDNLLTTHNLKRKAYGSETDPYQNIRASAESYSVPAWVAANIRAEDKDIRIQNLYRQSDAVRNGESIEDNLLDRAIYSIIALILYRECGY